MTDLNSQKLSRFAMSVNSDVSEQLAKIRRETAEEKTAILKAVEEKVLYECYSKIQKAVRKIEGKYRREAALEEQELRTEVLQCRNGLVKKMFEAVEEKIVDFVNSNKYEDFLIKQLGGEDLKGAIIRISEQDEKYIKTLREHSGCVVQIAEDIKLGGIALLYEDRGVIIDKTFDIALEEHRQNFFMNYSFKNAGGTVDDK